MSNACRVIKVGGSLFRSNDLPGRLANWLARQEPMHNVIITGGGEWADQVRQLDQAKPLRQDTAHWMAIRAMGLTAWILANSMSEVAHVASFAELRSKTDTAGHINVIFDPLTYLHQLEPTQDGESLPIGWHVTSDSIAARLAHVIHARELVLLKSVACPASIEQAQRAGRVDAYFVRACRGLSNVRMERL